MGGSEGWIDYFSLMYLIFPCLFASCLAYPCIAKAFCLLTVLYHGKKAYRLIRLMLTRIKDLAAKLAPRLIEIRRHIHSHPELSGHEYQTAAFVAGVLSSSGLHVQEGVGKTGVIG